MDEMYRLAGACPAYNQSGPAAQIWVLCKKKEKRQVGRCVAPPPFFGTAVLRRFVLLVRCAPLFTDKKKITCEASSLSELRAAARPRVESL